MIKILDDTKILSQLVNDDTNGIGQFQPLSAVVTEELNGIYEAEITMLATDKHYSDLHVDGILQIQVKEESNDSTQIFRIYYISKPINDVITIKAAHITYDLNKIPVKPFNATGAVNTKNGMLNNIVGTYPFTMTTDITNNTSYFSLDVPRSFRECLGGYEGSILDTFRCEYEWNNLNVGMLAHRGTDNGVRIAYGKNLTDINQEENIENVYTAVLGYAKKTVDNVETTTVGNIYTKVQATYPRVLIVDFSQDYFDTDPSVEDLTLKAQEYATNNPIEVPNVNITVSFVPLYQTEEYKNIAPLERVSLGDTVHIFFEKLGIETSARVVKTVWNVNLKKYDSVELGSIKSSLSSVIDSSMNQIKNEIIDSIDVSFDTGAIERQVTDLGNLITNGLGLHMTTVEVAGGGYRLYLHNKETLAESDTQYTMGADGFVVSTDYGQTWNAGFDAEGNAVVNSLSTIILKALEIYGSYIVFGDYPDGKYIEASTYSNSSSVPQGVSFDGTGTIRMQPQEAFIVNNRDSNGNAYNDMSMSVENNQTIFRLRNYDTDYRTELANMIRLSTNLVRYGTLYENNLYLNNCHTYSGTSYNGNSILMSAAYDTAESASNSSLDITNYGAESTNYGGNRIYMKRDSMQSLMTISNNQYNLSTQANSIEFSSSAISGSAYNNLVLSNYKYQTNTLVNRIRLYSGSSQNTLYISNKGYQTGTSYDNEIQMESGIGDMNYFRIENKNPNNATSGNYIVLNANTVANENYMLIANCQVARNTLVNYLKLNNGTNQFATLWSNSDLRLRSGGAVRIFANLNNNDTQISETNYPSANNGAGQDVNIGGKTVKIQCLSGGYISLYWGTTRVNLKRVTVSGVNVIGYDTA